MILDWSASDFRSKDSTKWPPVNALLSDLLVYKVIAAEISSTDRSRRWPLVFQSSGHIIADKVNMGPAANQLGEDQSPHDLIYRRSYILHGDLGAMRRGSKNAQTIGEKAVNTTIKGKSYAWTLNEPLHHDTSSQHQGIGICQIF